MNNTKFLKYSIVFCFWLIIQSCPAQNLVPNPGFEEFKKCPTSFSTDPLHFGPDYWNSPTQGTPDYYNKCSVGDMDVPHNWAGVSFAHAGVGYAGIYAWSNNNKNYREYVQSKLSEPLKAGNDYTIQFYYRLSSYSVYAIDRIGLALLNSEVKVDHDKLLEIKPILTEIKDLETLTNAWHLASIKIRAKDGEQFLIIGNFSSDEATQNMKIEYREGKSLMLGNSAYYYLDDIAVYSEEKSARDTAQFVESPKPNQVYILRHIYFQFDSFELLPSSFDELDDLISVLNKKPNWKIELSGHTDDQGTDDYNLALSQNRAKSVGEYLEKNGVTRDRIQTRGFGKQKPLKTGSDELARAVNRRVEAKFLEDAPKN